MEQTIPTENEACGTGHLIYTTSKGVENQETGAAVFHTTVQSSPTSVLLKTVVAPWSVPTEIRTILSPDISSDHAK